MLADACVFNLSQLGELAGKIDPEYRKQYEEVPWRSIYGLRNRIVHDYEGVNLRLLWEIISEDVPELIEKLNMVLSS